MIWIERSDVDTCSIYCSSSGYFVLCFSSNAEALLKAFSASPIFPRCFFTSSSILSGAIFLTGICFFTVCILAGGFLAGGRLFMNSVNIIKGRPTFEAKIQGGKANSFKSRDEAVDSAADRQITVYRHASARA